MTQYPARHQRGVFMIEALVAILVFAVGMLGMLGMAARGMTAQADARYRNDAANYANEIASVIALGVDRTQTNTQPTTIQTSLPAFQHRPLPLPPDPDPSIVPVRPAVPPDQMCHFTGDDTTNPAILGIIDRMTPPIDPSVIKITALPGFTAGSLQVVTNNSNTGFNRVSITVCWQAAEDLQPRHHTLVTYIN